MMDEELNFGGKDLTIKDILMRSVNVLSQPCPSNLEICEANKNIIEILDNPQILDILIECLLCMNGDDKKSKLILSFISTYISKQTKCGINAIRHKKWDIYEKMRGVFLLDTVKRSHKNLLQNTYYKFVYTLSSQFIKIRSNLTNFAVEYFEGCEFTAEMIDRVENGLYLIRVLLAGSGRLQSDSFARLSQNLLMKFIRVSAEMMKDLCERAQTDLTPLTPQLQFMEKIVRITRQMFCKTNENKLLSFKEQVQNSQIFYSLVHNIIYLQLPGQRGFLTPNSIINNIKEEVFIMLNSCLEFMVKRIKTLIVEKYQSFFIISREILKKVLPMILADVDVYPETPFLSERCMVEGIMSLAWVIRNPYFFQQAFQLRDAVLFRLCFKLQSPKPADLLLRPEQLFQMKENMIKLDLISRVNDASEKVIQAYADKVDGSISYLWKATLNLMDFQLTARPKYLEDVPDYLKETYFFQKLDYFQQFQTCLQMLGSLSYLGGDRKDLVALLEEFIVRRQEFFSRIDVPPTLIVCFLLCYSYYQDDFHLLILEKKANYAFHRSFIFHAHQLLKVTFDPQKKDLISSKQKIIGLAVKDFFTCLVSQKNFLHLFPEQDPQSQGMLINFFKKFLPYMNSQFNLYIVEDILLEFVKEILRPHFNSGLKQVPLMVRSRLCFELAKDVCEVLQEKIINFMICKTKLIELLRMLFLLTNQPNELMKLCLPALSYMANNEIPNLSDVLELLKVFFWRMEKTNQPSLERVTNEIISYMVLKASSVVQDEAFDSIFVVLLHLNMEKINYSPTMGQLITLFEERIEELDYQNDIEKILIRILYLMTQISIIQFSGVLRKMWQKVLDLMLQYLNENHANRGFLTGKMVTLCLCIYQQDPVEVEKYLGERADVFWNWVLDDPQKYTMVDKRIICIKLLQLCALAPVLQPVSNKMEQILKSCAILLYYIHEKGQQEWAIQGQSDMESQLDEESQGGRKQPWEEQISSLKENVFTKILPNEIILMRDICHQFNKQNSHNFRNFINTLPIASQNLIKNKIYHHEDNSNRQLRTIVRLKKHS